MVLPTKKVSGVVFGGPNLDVLFVTTEQTGFDTDDGGLTNGGETLTSVSGSIFMVKGLNARGYAGRKLCL